MERGGDAAAATPGAGQEADFSKMSNDAALKTLNVRSSPAEAANHNPQSAASRQGHLQPLSSQTVCYMRCLCMQFYDLCLVKHSLCTAQATESLLQAAYSHHFMICACMSQACALLRQQGEA